METKYNNWISNLGPTRRKENSRPVKYGHWPEMRLSVSLPNKTGENPSRLEWIRDGLQNFIENYKSLGVTSVAFPLLGL